MPATAPSGIPWLGEMPAHWEAKRLKYLASTNDEALAESADPSQEIVYVEIGGVDAVEGIVAKEQVVLEDAPSRARRLVRHGDTIVSTVRTYLRAIAPIRDPEPNLVVSTGFAVIRPRELDPDYLGYALRSPYFIETIVSRSTGVSYPGINASEIGNIEIAYPPLPEQRAIAAFLDERTARIDGLIARKQRLVQLLKEKRQALITRAVTRGLDAKVRTKESGVPWLGEVPEHWGVKRIGHLCSVVRGSTPRPAGDERYFNGSAMPWITVSEITGATGMYITSTETCLTEEGVTYSRIVEEGTLLLSNSGATLGVPRIAGIRGCLNDGCAAFLRLVPQVDRDFLYYFFESHTAVYRADTQVSGQPNLNTDLIGSTLMAVPPLAEQRAIVHAIQRSSNRIDALITKVEQAVLRLQEYRTALISAAVTGKVRVG